MLRMHGGIWKIHLRACFNRCGTHLELINKTKTMEWASAITLTPRRENPWARRVLPYPPYSASKKKKK